MLRKIVRIDEAKCDGCGQCIPSCAEGAIALVGGKARLSSDVLCDGLGACLGECPQGAITVEEREAAAFDEEAVKAHLLSSGVQVSSRHAPAPAHAAAPPPAPALAAAPSAPRSRLSVVSDAGPAPAGGGCPGSRPMTLPRRAPLAVAGGAVAGGGAAPAAPESRLGQWPVQLHLVPVRAPYFQGADLLVAADCVPFAYAGFHQELLAGRALVVGCPKLDDLGAYVEKLQQIVAVNGLRSVTVVRMEVPCCGGISMAARRAVEGAAPGTPFRDVVVGVDGTLRG
jgi:NAD-dependent dihydropyrimidine dehydrogenase PreA subunit